MEGALPAPPIEGLQRLPALSDPEEAVHLRRDAVALLMQSVIARPIHSKPLDYSKAKSGAVPRYGWPKERTLR